MHTCLRPLARWGGPLVVVLLAGFLTGCSADPPGVPEEDPFPHRIRLDRAGVAWAESTLQHMSREQKVSQLFAVPAPGTFGSTDSPEHRRVVELVRDLQVGGVIFFQGTPHHQAAFANEMQREAPVPLLISQDMETGAGMRLTGATRLPSAMAIAATRDPDLAYLSGSATALEARAVGVRHVLAPVADVNANAGNPVIDIRSFSDQPGLAAVMVDAFVRGLQDGGVLATAKHFPGHGSTSRDSHFSMPVLTVDYARIDSVDLVPFRAAVSAGAASIMTAHVAFPNLDAGSRRPATLSPPLVNGLLRDSLNFQGLIVSDALNMAGVQQGTPGTIAVDAFRAGVDMLMMSTNVRAARRALLAAIENGTISESELDMRVRRILRAKASAGLHTQRFAPLDDVRREVANADQRALSARVAREGLTLLGDTAAAGISDRPGTNVAFIAVSDRSDPERHHPLREMLRDRLPGARMETVLVTPGTATSMQGAVRRAVRAADDVVVAVYATASSWRYRRETAGAIRQVFRELQGQGAHIVVLGTPYVASAAPSDARVFLTYGDGPAELRAAADAVSRRADVSGRTPVALSVALPVGSGQRLQARYPRMVEAEEAAMVGAELDRIETLMAQAIADRAFPGAAVAVGRPGALVHTRGYGTYTYDSATAVTETSVFDLASLTKVIATTTAIMQLYEQGRLDLDRPVMHYVHDFGQNGKDSVTVRQLLTHTGGLIPFRPFYRQGIRSRGRVLQAIFDEELVYEPGTESRYSDFGPIILAEIVERVSGRGFATYAREEIFEPLGMWDTGFRAVGRGARGDVVPTEADRYFRYRLLQGEVHDETAWIMGGVAGHAGLFSTVQDLSRFANMIVRDGRIGDRQFLQPETIELFTTAVNPEQHSRALGWDTKSPERSSAGRYFGPSSFGHTGFTGTSIWFDPDEELYLILLSNRVYPSRRNSGHVPVRRALADLVHETIMDPDHTHVAD